MFRVEVNNGTFVEDMDENVQTTVLLMIQEFQNKYRFRFANTPEVRDSSQGNAPPLQLTDATSEGRTYSMTCWITRQLDENNEPIKKSIYI